MLSRIETWRLRASNRYTYRTPRQTTAPCDRPRAILLRMETLRTALAPDYRLERVLGTGGSATVYLARDLKHDRQVAIKVLHPELSETVGGDRFIREIRFAARLTHPNIVPPARLRSRR